MARVARSIEYVGAMDTTLSGSRNAITPLMLWYAFQLHGLEGFRDIVTECLESAQYAVDAFKRHRHPGVAQQELDNRRVSASGRSRRAKMADGALRRLRAPNHGSPNVTRDKIDAAVADCVANPLQ